MNKVFLLSLVLLVVLPFSFAFASLALTSNDPYLTLVNKTHPLPEDWTDRVDFDVGKNSLGEIYIVEQEALAAFMALRACILEEEGVEIELDSTYRSLAEQQDIWDSWSADPELGPEYCEKYLAPVGCSEHHTGLAIDVFLIRDGEIVRDNDAMLADTESFAKVHKHLTDFGFILRYPKGKESLTGYSYEPWHFRYVGKSAAKELAAFNMTLEEYFIN